MAALNEPQPAPPPNPLGRRGRWFAFVLVALVVNLPVVQGWRADRQLEREGVAVRAEVVDSVLLDSDAEARPVVAFELPPTGDDERAAGTRWAVEVDEPTYDRALRDGAIDVRVLPGRPGVFEVPGAVGSRVGLVLTLVVDAVLVGILVALRRRRRAEAAAGGTDTGTPPGPAGRPADGPADLGPDRGPDLDSDPGPDAPVGGGVPPGAVQLGARGTARLVAEGDLAPLTPGLPRQPHPDGSLELRGPLVGIRDDEVVLDVEGTRVLVDLGGHRVGRLRFGDPVQVRVREQP
ncbi:hypothetical protein [Nocardioides perillae]|uniref:Uncharacterized protein n=1 Tax=Nocardioides perillae TaxID=1119534 RepID=A0A7Y9RPP0_9ACTN|nr:hypothetical protein [Nocardioides perillae]NYG54246.1 hypothetical protein [Nocardioides perillae]